MVPAPAALGECVCERFCKIRGSRYRAITVLSKCLDSERVESGVEIMFVRGILKQE